MPCYAQSIISSSRVDDFALRPPPRLVTSAKNCRYTVLSRMFIEYFNDKHRSKIRVVPKSTLLNVYVENLHRQLYFALCSEGLHFISCVMFRSLQELG
jgi:hypothetical protein